MEPQHERERFHRDIATLSGLIELALHSGKHGDDTIVRAMVHVLEDRRQRLAALEAPVKT